MWSEVPGQGVSCETAIVGDSDRYCIGEKQTWDGNDPYLFLCKLQSKKPAEAGFLQKPGFDYLTLRVPTTSISTRRFLARPSAVLLSATGCFSPLPSV